MTDYHLDRQIDTLIELALEEDLRDKGDITTTSFVPGDHQSAGDIRARESLVVCGTEIAQRVFQKLDPAVEIQIHLADGQAAEKGDNVLSIKGNTRAILTAERTALNFMQRLSGIATRTRTFVDKTEGTIAEILDTRKTTPGWRHLEKAAVSAGGGTNHRMGLYDAVMVKDNHLVAEDRVSALADGIARARQTVPGIKIELEVDTLEQLADFLELDEVDVVLLDNMTCDQLTRAVKMRNAKQSSIKLEASGGVNLETVGPIAQTGVDYISIGGITHSATAVDLGLDLRDL